MNNSTKDEKVRGVIEINFPPAESDGRQWVMHVRPDKFLPSWRLLNWSNQTKDPNFDQSKAINFRWCVFSTIATSSWVQYPFISFTREFLIKWILGRKTTHSFFPFYAWCLFRSETQLQPTSSRILNQDKKRGSHYWKSEMVVH